MSSRQGDFCKLYWWPWLWRRHIGACVRQVYLKFQNMCQFGTTNQCADSLMRPGRPPILRGWRLDRFAGCRYDTHRSDPADKLVMAIPMIPHDHDGDASALVCDLCVEYISNSKSCVSMKLVNHVFEGGRGQLCMIHCFLCLCAVMLFSISEMLFIRFHTYFWFHTSTPVKVHSANSAK
jgi:hypothetical protein